MRPLTFLVALLLAAALNFAFWYLPNRPRDLPEVWTGGPLKSASFAPYRRGQSPLTATFASAAEIEADLAAMQGHFSSIRTYSALEGIEVAAQRAGKYGLTVTHGAWIGGSRVNNDAEVTALIAAANKYPDTIKRLMVGNEVLLRRELPVDELAGYIRRVKAAVKQPVSYADVWEFWLRNPQLAREVDFITVHFLPYWEDDPVGVDHAMEHILAVYEKVKAAFPGKPILIGEVGWPGHGRSREEAAPGRFMQAYFLNSFALLAARHGMDYSIVEAFDQPWKSAQEGTVGANWGLLDAARQVKYPLTGPIVENPHWLPAFAVSTLLAVLAGMALFRAGLAPAPLFATALLGQAFATMVVLGGQAALSLWWDKHVYLWPGLMVVLQAVLAALLLRQAQRRLSGPRHEPSFRTAGMSFADFRENWALFLPLGHSTVSVMKRERFAVRWRKWLTEWLLLAALLLAVVEMVWLAVRVDLPEFRATFESLPPFLQGFLYTTFNGRYRDFPIGFFLVPGLGFALLRLVLMGFGRLAPMAAPERRQSLRFEWVAIVVMLLATLGMNAAERFVNREAWGWTAVALLLLWPLVERILANRRAPA